MRLIHSSNNTNLGFPSKFNVGTVIFRAIFIREASAIKESNINKDETNSHNINKLDSKSGDNDAGTSANNTKSSTVRKIIHEGNGVFRLSSRAIENIGHLRIYKTDLYNALEETDLSNKPKKIDQDKASTSSVVRNESTKSSASNNPIQDLEEHSASEFKCQNDLDRESTKKDGPSNDSNIIFDHAEAFSRLCRIRDGKVQDQTK